MSSKSSENSKSYKSTAMLFALSGIIFIILSIVSGIYFLPIGIALFIISILSWQRSKYLEKHKHKDSNRGSNTFKQADVFIKGI